MDHKPTRKNELSKFGVATLLSLAAGSFFAWQRIALDRPFLWSIGSAVFLGLAALFLLRGLFGSTGRAHKWLLPVVAGVIVGVAVIAILGLNGGTI